MSMLMSKKKWEEEKEKDADDGVCVHVFNFVLFCFLGLNVCHYKMLQLAFYILCPSQGISYFPQRVFVPLIGECY